MMFQWSCSLPPTENHLHEGAGRRRYPAQSYKDWISLEAVYLMLALRAAGIREPDTRTWWLSRGLVYVPRSKQADGATAYTKAVHDLLSGSQIDRHTRRIVKPGAFWDDDKRVRGVMWTLDDVAHPEGRVVLTLEEMAPPENWQPRS